ncbi:MAG: bifunctional (p)ppGpp synthetase/guanosine-3',5'-bis(diphosphate) 3'-pyrophosphohydrolase [Proteobacteria bacterium]|nr:bifunctional (p)ppGpp synthetase/guanosine-3',5'-bis(diphosphate) 3'-pyrophosphohydrolase [Pseudomonadota bacterium]
MIRINDILDRILDYNPEAELDVVERAYIYSARVHDGQIRLSGEPYLTHPLEVAGILTELKLDVESIAAGLLHDVIEDTHATDEEIKNMFGANIQHIVSGVTKLSKLTFQRSEERQAESIRKMILAMADDIRVVLIKLADRVHNMRTLHFHKKEQKKLDIAQETFDIYVPIASRLGIYWIKKELEDTSFKYLQPEDYERIKTMVSKDQDEREKSVDRIRNTILEKIKEAGINGEVLGRYKQFYSIYTKMVKQGLSFEEVYDIIAFRIILGTIPECYTALGVVHNTWQPIPKKFKDYIGVPKPNRYQSLHTTVIGPDGERIEIQIRTHDMDKVAKSGIAAHWSYKEGKSYDQNAGETYSWIQNLVENQANSNTPEEFMENVRIDLFPDEVYVFTPKGDVKSLPKGATPLDFAYAIHTEIGNQCTGAKVNGKLVPLTYDLKTGDTVEVIITKGHTPSQDWLSHVKTVRARSRIRHWIKSQEHERSLSLGKELCEKAFRRQSLNFNKLYTSPEMEDAAKAFGLKTVDELIINVGYGKLTPTQLVHKFKEPEKEKDESIINRLMGRSKKKKTTDGVIVRGIDDVLIKFGKCCQPVPGDPIVGYITQGQGVTIHRAGCPNALNMNPERNVSVVWDTQQKDTFPVEILVRSQDQMGLLAEITTNISKNGANIMTANTHVRDDQMYDSQFTIGVQDKDHLRRVITSLKKLKFVQSVLRITN